MDADFIGSPCEFAKPKAAVLMRVAKSRGNFGDRLRSFFTKIGRQFVRRFSDSFRKQDFNYSAPAKGSSLAVSRDAAISASAASSANVA